MTTSQHWEKGYQTNPPDEVGWYEPRLETSLRWIRARSLDEDSPIIDVGGGASTLIDDLLAGGYRSITVLDLSRTALAWAKKRLGERASSVTWLEADITFVDPPACHYDLWHDRAVFHFLTHPQQQERYVDNLLKALRPSGRFIIATFSLEAPPSCSGLPVKRYSADESQRTLGSKLRLKKSVKELHVTPGGVEQMYLYGHFQRTA